MDLEVRDCREGGCQWTVAASERSARAGSIDQIHQVRPESIDGISQLGAPLKSRGG